MSAEQNSTRTEPAASTPSAATQILPLSRDGACTTLQHPDRLSPAHWDRSDGHAAGTKHSGREQARRDAEDHEQTWQQRAEIAEQRVATLERALGSRATIDQAKGVIIGVFGLGPDDAFEVLVWVSQNANVKLATVAARFLDAARALDLGHGTREQLAALLAELAGRGPTSSSENDHRSLIAAPPV